MKKVKGKIDVIFLGRYNTGEILTGPEKVAKRIFGQFSQEKKSIFIEYFFDGNEYGRFKKLFGKEIIKNENDSAILRLGLIRILLHLISVRPKVVHIITNERFPVIVIPFKKLLRFKIVYNVHSIFKYEYDQLKWRIKKSLLKREEKVEKKYFEESDALLFLDIKSLNISKKYYSFAESKVRLIKNGVDNVFFHLNAKKKLLANENLKVVFSGNIKRRQKGFDFFVSAIAKLKLKIDLYLISEETYSGFDSNDYIKIHLYQKLTSGELADFYKDKDVFFSTSLYDSFSIAAAEAMASGLVCILTRQTGISEYIENRKEGFVIDYGDEDSLIIILNELNDDRDLLRAVSENGRKFAEQLEWEKIFNDYKKIYSELGVKI